MKMIEMGKKQKMRNVLAFEHRDEWASHSKRAPCAWAKIMKNNALCR